VTSQPTTIQITPATFSSLNTAQIAALDSTTLWSLIFSKDQIAALSPDQKTALRTKILSEMATFIVNQFLQPGGPNALETGMKQQRVYDNYPGLFTFEEVFAMGAVVDTYIGEQITQLDEKNKRLDQNIAKLQEEIDKLQEENKKLNKQIHQ